jgi:hypothetical protein
MASGFWDMSALKINIGGPSLGCHSILEASQQKQSIQPSITTPPHSNQSNPSLWLLTTIK